MELSKDHIEKFHEVFKLAQGLLLKLHDSSIARLEISKHVPYTAYSTFGNMTYYISNEWGKKSLQASIIFVELYPDTCLWHKGFEFLPILFPESKGVKHLNVEGKENGGERTGYMYGIYTCHTCGCMRMKYDYDDDNGLQIKCAQCGQMIDSTGLDQNLTM